MSVKKIGKKTPAILLTIALIISASVTLMMVPPAVASGSGNYKFNSGFEIGDLDEEDWKITSGTAEWGPGDPSKFTLTSAAAHHGDKGLRVISSRQYDFVRHVLDPMQKKIYVRFYYRYSALPTGTDKFTILQIRGYNNRTDDELKYVMDVQGAEGIINATIPHPGIATIGMRAYHDPYQEVDEGGEQCCVKESENFVEIKANEWHLMEAYVKLSTGTYDETGGPWTRHNNDGEFRFWVDGNLVWSKTGTWPCAKDGVITHINRVFLGAVLDGPGSKNIDIDCVRISTESPAVKGPVANLKWTPKEIATGETVTFDAAPSCDLPGTITGWAWDFNMDGTADRTTETTTWSWGVGGTYQFNLTVTDNDGNKDWAVKKVKVAMPEAKFEFYDADGLKDSEAKPGKGESVKFNATDSKPSKGKTIQNYTWNFDDTNTTTTANAIIYHSFSAGKKYNVTLKMCDEAACSDLVYKIVNVGFPNANFSYTPIAPLAGNTVTFNGTQEPMGSYPPWRSSDKDDTITSYKWQPYGNTTGEATTTNGTFSYTYPYIGEFVMELNVTDSDGQTSATTREVDVGVRSLIADMTGNTFNSPSYAYDKWANRSMLITCNFTNFGDVGSGTVDFALYYNSTLLSSASGSMEGKWSKQMKNTTETFVTGANETRYWEWDPWQPAWGYYILNATVTVIPGEGTAGHGPITDNYVTKTVQIRRVGDANGDGHCDGFDFTMVNVAWLTRIGHPFFRPEADMNGDDGIDGFDFTYVNVNWLLF